jgi:hypothetical protein
MVRGTTALDGAEDGLVPTGFCATTVKVYEVPLVKLLMTQLRGPWAHVQVLPLGDEVTVYEVTG